MSRARVASTALLTLVALELVWTIVPFFILIAIAFPATRTVMRDEGHLRP